ncbi:Transposase DDE domain-containing protein [Anaerovirgula multivorans]|uniref:Transposase DDE domain-containing protein n=1 Tax=Anaerovirgula multivorans TaxID=312168 RepID=A0A239C903_9FIRM|nr:IS1634 family transposase [Anaerovirgula multivorans]SNS16707.1 Transposase DDE domain-containing protein [Anaerovirgula multivorans]
MRLSLSKSKNATPLYVIKDVIEKNKRTTKIVEKLGTINELEEKLSGQDPIEWAKKYIAELNEKEKEETSKIMVQYSPTKLIEKEKQHFFNGGYLFFQKIYHELGLHKICKEISDRYKFTFNLDSILSRLLYGRIIFPSSKLSTYNLSSKFLEKPVFDIQHIYRALEVISKETHFIQSELYKNSLKLSKQNAGILYYDCTNYFFEIEQKQGLKQYGYSKEHKPNSIVQMRLFMDGDGIPLTFSITKGNTNEQLTLKPLEQKILDDFKLSKFVICTDAGLASTDNRKFNDQGERAFITTQSVKKLKKHLKEWALSNEGWHLSGDNKVYDIFDIKEDQFTDRTFYKERWIKENGLEQKLIVTYSIKYRDYQRKIRNAQIDRAVKVVETNPSKLKKSNQNDYKRFVEKTSVTLNGEVAEKHLYSINLEVIAKEEAYDGFYAVCTNLEDEASEIIKINHRRWEIEECFRIMKSEFKARPVYLTRDDRIEAHFTTCFLAMVLYRYLEKRLNSKFTCSEIVQGLKDMNFYEIPGDGYIPTYMRTDFTDVLHEAFGFRTDYQIMKNTQMKKIFKDTKN